MGSGQFGGDPALGRSIDEAESQEERFVDVLDRLDLLGQDGCQGSDTDRTRPELLDDRGQELSIRGVEALVVDLHRAHGGGRRRFIDPPVAVDLGVVPDALEQPVDDARRATTASSDGHGRRVVDLDAQDDGRPIDDRR